MIELLASLLFYAILTAAFIAIADVLYTRPGELKKHILTRRWGHVMEEYQKLLARDFSKDLPEPPQIFAASRKMPMVLIGAAILLLILLLLPDSAVWERMAITLISLFLLISAVVSLAHSYMIGIGRDTMYVQHASSLLSAFLREPAKTLEYAAMEQCSVTLKAQKGMYGRYGVGFRLQIETPEGGTDLELHNFETPQVRRLIAYLLQKLGARLTINFQGF
jgi:hypothetical protein